MNIFIDTRSFKNVKFYCTHNGIILKTLVDNIAVEFNVGKDVSDLFTTKLPLNTDKAGNLFQGLMSINSARSTDTVFTKVSQFDSNLIVEINVINNSQHYFLDQNKQVANELKGLKWIESHLREEVSNFKYVENFAKVGYWIYHISENSLTISDGLFSILAVEKKIFHSDLDDFFHLIPSSEITSFKDKYLEHLKSHNKFQMTLSIDDPQNCIHKKLEFKSTITIDKNTSEIISFVVVQDVTKILSTKENLQRNQAILKKLSDNISEVLIVFNLPNFKPTYISNSYEKLMGKNRETSSFESSILTGVSNSEKELVLKVFNLASRGEKCSIEYRYKNPTTNSTQYHRMSLVPIQENGSKIKSIAAVISDISVYKRAELQEKQQQEELRKVDKMRSLASLVSGVAHEINNPNNLIMLNCTFLMKVWDEIIPILDEEEKRRGTLLLHNLPYEEIRKEFAELLLSILNGSDRIKSIVASLRKFVLADNSDTNNSIDLNNIIVRVVDISYNKLKKSSSECNLHLNPNIRAITGNESQIQQLFLNILKNSCEAATEEGQRIEITTDIESDLSAKITIKDYGCGIHSNDLENIFEPFFTTKRDIHCEGLGLAVSYGIVEQHSGTISIESEYSVGTEVTILLPVALEY